MVDPTSPLLTATPSTGHDHVTRRPRSALTWSRTARPASRREISIRSRLGGPVVALGHRDAGLGHDHLTRRPRSALTWSRTARPASRRRISVRSRPGGSAVARGRGGVSHTPSRSSSSRHSSRVTLAHRGAGARSSGWRRVFFCGHTFVWPLALLGRHVFFIVGHLVAVARYARAHVCKHSCAGAGAAAAR